MADLASLIIDPDCRDLVGFIQTMRESQRGDVARVLHDEIGSALIAALLDSDSATRALRDATDPASALAHLVRAQSNLRTAISANRDIQESLRPSLLDEFGLYAACRWLGQGACRKAKLAYVDEFPETEPKLTARASIALYRAVEGLITITLKESDLASLKLSAFCKSEFLELCVSHTHRTAELDDLGQSCLPEISETVERARALGGICTIARSSASSSATIAVPIENVSEAVD